MRARDVGDLLFAAGSVLHKSLAVAKEWKRAGWKAHAIEMTGLRMHLWNEQEDSEGVTSDPLW
eukprot:13751174-Alexandrium_andersonii.AAC.1